MKAIDTHVHLNFSAFDKDRQAVIDQLEAEDIGVINIATDEESLEAVNKLSAENKLIWGAVGLHPTEAGPQALMALAGLIKKLDGLLKDNPKIVAIGEIGLDYFHSKEQVGDQKVILAEQLNYALKNDIPVIFHCRDAYGDLLTILGHYPKIRGVIHCYSGTREQVKEYLKMGFYISFTGMLTYNGNDALRETSLEVPLDKLLLETDSPFLSPQSSRGKRNDPMGIIEIAAQHAELRKLSVEQILKDTTGNAARLFGLN